ncbi:MAG: YajG family lipoprotein [Betaproteobacteria bacterium]
MKNTIWTAMTIGALALTQGCALKPQDIRIDPTIELSKAQTGNAKTIGVAVSDARPTKKLGQVGDPDGKMVEVSVNQDAGPVIYSRVSDALGDLGYKVTPQSNGTGPNLRIEVQSLKLDSDKRAFDFLTTLRAEVTARVDNGRSHFERIYTVNQTMNSAGPSYTAESSRLVNTAVSMALQDMLSDQKLLEALNK